MHLKKPSFRRTDFSPSWTLLGGFGIEPSHTQKIRERLCEGCWQQNPQKQQIPFPPSGRRILAGKTSRYYHLSHYQEVLLAANHL
jgi:hypothetical protein